MLPNAALSTNYIKAEVNKSNVQYEGSSANNNITYKHNCSWRCVDYTHKKIYCDCICHKYTFNTKAQIRKREEKATRRLLRLVARKTRSVLTT
jgi:hypothetical protein